MNDPQIPQAAVDGPTTRWAAWAAPYVPTTFGDIPPRNHDHDGTVHDLVCPCGGGIESAVVMIGRIPASATCRECGGRFLVARVDGVTTVEKYP